MMMLVLSSRFMVGRGRVILIPDDTRGHWRHVL
jgi:hypothetical protein